MCCGQWDLQKGLNRNNELSYTEIFSILGKLAFDSFDQPCYRLLEFDNYINDNVKLNINKQSIINNLLDIGIFKVNENISFSHKLFKEYFAAYYLIKNYPLLNNLEMYTTLLNNENWKEVMIFSAGLFNSIEEQDVFLDLTMENNLKLYIECVNSKNDLIDKIATLSKNEYAYRYLQLLLSTYSFIVNKYFTPIKYMFDPSLGVRENNNKNKKMRIVGNISGDGAYLHYWFELVSLTEPDVLFLEESQLANYHKQFEHNAMLYGRRISSAFVNLSLSNLKGDSARKVSINKVKQELKQIIEKRKLLESNYILCERVEAVKKKINEIKNCSDIHQMNRVISEKISKFIDDFGCVNLSSYNYKGIDLISLNKLLILMDNEKINYSECLLPKEDICPSKETNYIWDMYSEKQKLLRISKFFYFHQLSYIEMVEKNFPLLCCDFAKYKDTPYQSVVEVIFKKDYDEFSSEPIIQYYHIASDTGLPKETQIKCTNDIKFNSEYIYDEIRNSYLKQGKIASELFYCQTGFSFTMISRRNGSPFPLSDYVYDSIKKSIENTFGNL